MADGSVPTKLLLMSSKRVRLANGVKLNWAKEAEMFTLERLIWETVPVASQVMEVQLQRLSRLVRDQELREVGEKDKLFFHWTSASACVLAEHVIFNGSKESSTTWNKTRQRSRKLAMLDRLQRI